MSGFIAVLNAGSSSIKFALYDVEDGHPRFRGQLQSIGIEPALQLRDDTGQMVVEKGWPAQGFDHAAATREILEAAVSVVGVGRVQAVGHRVVHGGMEFSAPVRVDAAVLARLEHFVPLAPLHQPHNLAPMHTIADHAPHLAQVACFDTAFHHGHAKLAQAFALPRHYFEEGVRRYGFHGLSYEFVAARLRELAPEIAEGRLVIGHLGNGASLCAIHHGESVASTMGFTAVEGLMMGTRCGSLDPGVLLYLIDACGMEARGIEDLLYRKSGLLGVSGISSDMRTLRSSEAPEAAEAIAMFVHRIVREIGSLAAALGGLDGLVFTGGIGENDVATRAEVMRGCTWLGLVPDEARNAVGLGQISAEGSKVAAWVVPTDEERMIARHTVDVLQLRKASD